jgi:hypothetical protein
MLLRAEEQWLDMHDPVNKEKQAAQREALLARYSAETQSKLHQRYTLEVNAPLLVLRFATYLDGVERGCSTALSHLVAECMHPLDNHVMPGVRYAREARKIARRLAKQRCQLCGKRSGHVMDRPALDAATLSSSAALSEAASRRGEEYYAAMHTINRLMYESNRSL